MATILFTLLILQTIGNSLFGKFESETPWWKKLMKWMLILLLILSSAHFFGATIALITLALLYVASLSFHFYWCRKHGIHPLHATPRKKYYQLRQWTWQE